MRRQVAYSTEFIAKFRELMPGQQRLVEDAVTTLLTHPDSSQLAHNLERRSYWCNWSHRVRANLLVGFRLSERRIAFISTGTHARAYRPRV